MDLLASFRMWWEHSLLPIANGFGFIAIMYVDSSWDDAP